MSSRGFSLIKHVIKVLRKVKTHLQTLKVLQKDVSNALVVSFDVCIRASFPLKRKTAAVFKK